MIGIDPALRVSVNRRYCFSWWKRAEGDEGIVEMAGSGSNRRSVLAGVAGFGPVNPLLVSSDSFLEK